jgi:hypothetical protein
MLYVAGEESLRMQFKSEEGFFVAADGSSE